MCSGVVQSCMAALRVCINSGLQVRDFSGPLDFLDVLKEEVLYMLTRQTFAGQC